PRALVLLFFSYCSAPHRDLHSFPTRRSSDLNIRYADLSGGVRDVTQGAQVVSLASLAQTLVATGVRSDPGHSPDVVRIDLRRGQDRKSTRLNSSHVSISYAVFCLKKKKKKRP